MLSFTDIPQTFMNLTKRNGENCVFRNKCHNSVNMLMDQSIKKMKKNDKNLVSLKTRNPWTNNNFSLLSKFLFFQVHRSIHYWLKSVFFETENWQTRKCSSTCSWCRFRPQNSYNLGYVSKNEKNRCSRFCYSVPSPRNRGQTNFKKLFLEA